MKNLPAPIPNRITYKKTTSEQIIDSKTPITRTRSPIRMIKTSQSSREPNIQVDAEFLQTAALAQQRTFSRRANEQDWIDLGNELKCSAADHLISNEKSRINQDLNKAIVFGGALQVVKTIDAKNNFDPLDLEEDMIQMIQVQENNQKINVSSIDEFEMYALSFDAVIDFMQAQNNSALVQSLISLKQYFLQKTASKPTQLKAMETAMISLDAQNMQQQRDYNELQHKYNILNNQLIVEQEKGVRSSKYQDQLREVIIFSENEKTEQARDIVTKTIRIEVMEKEIKQTSQLLNDALARCKRLSYASQKLKTVAEKASERYSNAERQLVFEQRARLQADSKKAEFEVQATRYLKEYEKMVKCFEDEQRRNEIERAKLYTKITNLQENSGFGSNLDSSQFNKIVQKACTTLIQLKSVDEYSLGSILGVDYDGIGSFIYIMNTIQNTDSTEKFIEQMKKQLFLGINVGCQASFNIVLDNKILDRQLKIQQNLLQLQNGQKKNSQQESNCTEPSVQVQQQDVFDLINDKQNILTKVQQTRQRNEIEEDSDDPIYAKEKYKFEQIVNQNGAIEYKKVKKQGFQESEVDKQVKARKKEARQQQLEFQKLMKQQLISIQDTQLKNKQSNSLDNNQQSLLELLQNNLQIAVDSSESEISNEDMIIQPEKFIAMTDDEKQNFTKDYVTYQTERKVRKQKQKEQQAQENYLRQNHFQNSSTTEQKLNNSDNIENTELYMFGEGFLDDKYMDKDNKSVLNNQSKSIKQQQIISLNRIYHQKPSTSKLQRTNTSQNDQQGSNQLQIDGHTQEETLQDISGSFMGYQDYNNIQQKSQTLIPSKNSTEHVNTNQVGILVSNKSIQASLNTVDTQLFLQNLRNSQALQPTKQQQEKEEVLNQIQMYIKQNPQLSQKELESITHISNSYIVYKSQQKLKGFTPSETLKSLQQAAVNSAFLNVNDTFIKQQLIEQKNFQIIHDLIQQSALKQGYQISQDTFYKTKYDEPMHINNESNNSLSITNNQSSMQSFNQSRNSIVTDINQQHKSGIMKNFPTNTSMISQVNNHSSQYLTNEKLPPYQQVENNQAVLHQNLEPLNNLYESTDRIAVYDKANLQIGVVNIRNLEFVPSTLLQSSLMDQGFSLDEQSQQIQQQINLDSPLKIIQIEDTDLDVEDLELKINIQQKKNLTLEQEYTKEDVKKIKNDVTQTNITQFVDKLKSSMFKDSQADGVLSSLTKARLEISKQEYYGESKKSIVAMYETKFKLKPVSINEIQELEDILEDTKAKEKDKLIQQVVHSQEDVSNSLNSMLNTQNRYKHLIDEQKFTIDEQQKYEDFVTYLNQKNYNDYYQIQSSTHLSHPIVGTCTSEATSSINIYGLNKFTIIDIEDMIAQKYGLVQNQNQIEFYPSIIARGHNIANWYKGQQLDKDKNDMNNITYRVLQNELDNIKQTSEITYQVCKKSLQPQIGENIDFIKVSSISVTSEKLPEIFTQLEQQQQIYFQKQLIKQEPYLKVPIFNNSLKSLNWTIKTIRMIIYERQFSTYSYLILKKAHEEAMITDISLTCNPDQFEIIPGQLQLQQAMSISSFTLLFAQQRYGLKNLVNQLLIQLITSIIYYQYVSSEVFIFTRFFFDDLPADFLLLYLDIRKALKIDQFNSNKLQNNISDITFDNEFILPLIQAIFPTWDSKRKFVLVQQLLQDESSTQISTIKSPIFNSQKPVKQQIDRKLSLSKVTAIILSQFSITRRTTFQNSAFLINHFAQNNSIKTAHFCQFLNSVSVNLEPKELCQKDFNFDEFKQIFVFYEFARFAHFTQQLLRGAVSEKAVSNSNMLEKLTKNANICFSVMTKYAEKTKTEEIENRFQIINKWFQLVYSDLQMLDFTRGIGNLVKIAIEMLKCVESGDEIESQANLVQVILEVVKEKIGY
ncbi:hypothetical protein SS50377_22021 [Spironucleus salmonicida]|uniref:Uncharacterized protein n=1 Tax=Spironucleus salmonicida TaxID=348837 RepID=V6LYD1_9EUKA|nr:hypothetical protein SS50377_22021 [Spironucleus salmonicida]|eukprot:EST45814.1 hypothetical protein SS50377_14389 [Spironucleus salmonicida]